MLLSNFLEGINRRATLEMKLKALLSLTLLLPLLACSSSSDSLQVFAAASLTEAFEQISTEFEKDSGIKVTLSIAGSSALAAQIEDGAPVDVVAFADEETLERVNSSGRLTTYNETIFASNYLTIATPKGNPADIRDIADFRDKIIAVCSERVPCGRLSSELISWLGVEINPATREPNVRAVRTKVELGEVDAGLIYITDINDQIESILIEGSENIQTKYPIAIIDDAKPGAENFVEFVLSPYGQKILEQFRFGGPSQ